MLVLLLPVLRFYWISLNRSKAIVCLMNLTFRQGQCDYFFWFIHAHKFLWDFLYFVTCLDNLILIYRHVCTARVMLLHESSYLTSQWIHWRFQVDVIWLLCKGFCLRSGISSIAQTVAVWKITKFGLWWFVICTWAKMLGWNALLQYGLSF